MQATDSLQNNQATTKVGKNKQNTQTSEWMKVELGTMLLFLFFSSLLLCASCFEYGRFNFFITKTFLTRYKKSMQINSHTYGPLTQVTQI